MKKGKYLKWKITLLLLGILSPPLFVMGIMVFAIAGGAEPISPPATEEKASEYQSVCSALGVSWDIPLLVDAMLNNQGIDDCDALVTALQFTILEERQFEITEETKEDENGNNQTIQYKTYSGSTEYVGKDMILGYVGCDEQITVNELISKASEVASSKDTSEASYEVLFKANEQIEDILSGTFGFNEDEIKDIMELHESNYIIQLYKGSVSIGTVELGDFDDNEEAIWTFLEAIGFNEIGRAAVMGNMKIESGLNPSANHNDHYFGICQWGGGRWSGNALSLSGFAASYGTSWNDLETQLNFFNAECSTSYSKVYMQMKNATDIIYATDYFCCYYEICPGTIGNWATSIIDGKAYQCLADRRAYAQAYYQKYVA